MSRWSSAIGRKYDVLQQNADANMMDAQSRRNLTDAQVRGMPAATDLTRARTSALNTLTPTEAALNNARAAGLGADAGLRMAQTEAVRNELATSRALFPEQMSDAQAQTALRAAQAGAQRAQAGLYNEQAGALADFRRSTAPPSLPGQGFAVLDDQGRPDPLALPGIGLRRRNSLLPEMRPLGFALGTENVQPMPAAGQPVATQPVRMPDGSYSFGGPRTTGGGGEPMRRNYAKGVARVPGKGDGTRDTVPANLAPGEAVLNRPAADMAGRGLIAALNALGAQRMGMV